MATTLLVASITPAYAYDVVVPGDLDGDLMVDDDELDTAEQSYDDGDISAEEFEKIEHIHENYPRTIVDTEGREVTFYKPVERVITRAPDNCRLVVALGSGDKIVASEQSVKSCLCPTNWGIFDQGCVECYNSIMGGRMPDLPETSTRYEIDYEEMASLYPDVIFTSSVTNAEEFENKVGCPCVVAGGTGWIYDDEGLYGQISVVGNVLEKEDEAEELIGFIQSKINMITSVTDSLDESEKPTVYFAPRGATKGFYDPKEGRDFTRTVTDYAPINLAGGINVADGSEGTTINVALEQIIAWDPDYIVVSCSNPDDRGAVDFVLTSEDLQSIKAVQNGAVYNCFYPYCRGNPPDRSLFNMVYMAKLFHPDEFQDLGLEKEGNEIFEAFLGVEGAFTEYADYLVWPREYLNSQ